jgi:hypothetical protein
MNKLDYNLTTLPNELQTYESLMQVKGQQGEANVVTSSRSFHKGSTSGTKPVPSTSSNNKWKKKKGGKGNKTDQKLLRKPRRSRLQKELFSIAARISTGRGTAQNIWLRRRRRRR